MSRSTATFSVSLPPEMARELERVRKSEHRTRSELVREALRKYMRAAEIDALEARLRQLPEEEPTAEELRAIKAAKKEIRDGGYRALPPVDRGIRRPSRQSRRKKP